MTRTFFPASTPPRQRRIHFAAYLMLFSGLFLLEPYVCYSQGRNVVDRIAAVVNDEIILLSDLEAHIKPYAENIKRMAYGQNKEREMISALGGEKLEELIEQRLVDQEIKRLHLSVSEDEIDQAIENIKRVNYLTNEDLREGLASQKMTLEQYRKQLGDRILQAKLVNREIKSKIVITEQDVMDYYNRHPEDFSTQKRYRLRLIMLPVSDSDDVSKRTETLRQIEVLHQNLKDGGSFKDLAAVFTAPFLKDKAGDLGWLTPDKLSPQILDALKGMIPGEYTNVLETDQGYQIIFLENLEAAGAKPMDAVYEQIETKLYDNVVEEKYRAWLKALREKAHIRIIR